jgi:hypothetical protein
MIIVAYIWLIIFGIATLLFFGVAATLAVRGINDLRHLLSSAGKRG